MKALRIVATVLFSIVLFFSLFGLGLTIMLNTTVLNPDFVVSRVNKIEIASLANDFLNNQSTQGQFPPEVSASLSKTITRLEPQLKQQIGAAIYPIYDYVNGKSKSIDLAQVLKNSLLKPEFIAAFASDLDLSSLTKQLIFKQISIPSGLPISQDKILQYFNDAISKAEPQIKQEFVSVIPSIVDYLLGISDSLNASISLKPIFDSAKDTIKADFLKSPPPQLAGIPPAQLEQIFNQLFAQLGTAIPSTIAINQNTLGDLSSVRAQIADSLASAKQVLDQARVYISYIDTVFKVSLVLTIVLIAGIILVNRRVKTSSRAIGITFVVSGALQLAGIYIARTLAQPYLAQVNLPANLQPLIPRLLDDIVEPLRIFGIIVLIVGAALIVVSIVYKRGRTA